VNNFGLTLSYRLSVCLFATVIPPECHIWGYNPQPYSARFARSNIRTSILKLCRRPCSRDSRHFDFASGPTEVKPASLHQASASALHCVVLLRSQFKLSSTYLMVDSIVIVWSLITLASCSSVLGPIQNDFDSGLQALDELCIVDENSIAKTTLTQSLLSPGC